MATDTALQSELTWFRIDAQNLAFKALCGTW